MHLNTVGDLALIFLCLILLALNVAAETAVTNISRLRLHQLLDRGVPRAQALSDLLGGRRLNTVLRTADLIVIIALSGLVVSMVVDLWPDFRVGAASLAVTALVALVFGFLAPQAIAIRHPERSALFLLGYVSLLRAVIGPLLGVLSWLAHPVARLLDGGKEAGHYLTEEDMRQIVHTGEEEGVIPVEEEEMIEQIFAFGDTVVREVMVPRTDMVVAADDEPLPVVVERILECGHTRLPVYHETVDNVIGIVNAKDMLRALHQGQIAQPLVEFVRKTHFIPETKKVDDLLRDLQRNRLPMAIVVDEYGGTAGLVTIEDLVEEIVGEIQDEYDREPVLLEPTAPNEWRCDARLPLDDLNDLLGTQLKGVDVETVGGLVQERLGRIPAVGDAITEEGIRITVLETEGLRVKQLEVRRHTAGDDEAPADPDSDSGPTARPVTQTAAPDGVGDPL
ncbi:MAG TPA: hemolysin family protein [Chloroflexia bacterium]|nr:hemolysin family protein [Chloroflexia bacterium]